MAPYFNKTIKPNADIIVFVIGLIIGLTTLWAIFGNQQTRFGQLGLGIGTQAVYQSHKGHPIHCGDLSNAASCLTQTNAALPKARIALLGWSQLHGINQYREGQKGTALLLTEHFDDKNIDFLTFSQGNANPQEHYIFFHWLNQSTDLDTLVIGAWIQGMREEGVRANIAIATQNAAIRENLEKTDLGRRSLEVIDRQTDNQPNHHTTLQDKTETLLLNTLDANIPLWAIRSEGEGQIRLFFRHIKFHIVKIRNTLLGLKKSEWIWPIPDARYNKNIEYLEGIVATAKEKNINVLIYIPPRPVDIHFPFDPSTYSKFKKEVETFSKKHGAQYANLEDCVTGSVWGMTRGGDGSLIRDMTHFTAGGHKQLVRCLKGELDKTEIGQR